MMGEHRIYADLNKWEEVKGDFSVILTTCGTQQDLQKYGVVLKEGLTLNFWMEDEDDEGNLDPLYFTGTVHYNEDAHKWVAIVERGNISNASELKVASFNKINAQHILEPAPIG